MRVKLLILGILASLLLAACTTTEPDATATPDPSPTPDATATPDASPTPDATETPEASPTPDPTPTATAEPSAYSGADGIEWLRDAGLEVTVLEEEQEADLPNYGGAADVTVTYLSVNDYETVWIYWFSEEPAEGQVGDAFNIGADFTSDTYPVPFTVSNLVILVRGTEQEPIRSVYTALWNVIPPLELAPFDLTLSSAYPTSAEAAETAESWLVEPDGADPQFSTATAGEARLVTIGDFTDEFPLDDALYDPLPHPDALVWAVPATGESAGATGEGYAVVLVDQVSGIVVGATYSDEALPIEEVPEAPRHIRIELTS